MHILFLYCYLGKTIVKLKHHSEELLEISASAAHLSKYLWRKWYQSTAVASAVLNREVCHRLFHVVGNWKIKRNTLFLLSSAGQLWSVYVKLCLTDLVLRYAEGSGVWGIRCEGSETVPTRSWGEVYFFGSFFLSDIF